MILVFLLGVGCCLQRSGLLNEHALSPSFSTRWCLRERCSQGKVAVFQVSPQCGEGENLEVSVSVSEACCVTGGSRGVKNSSGIMS